VTIWPRKHKRKTPSQAFTRSKQMYRFGRSLKNCGTVHWHGPCGFILEIARLISGRKLLSSINTFLQCLYNTQCCVWRISVKSEWGLVSSLLDILVDAALLWCHYYPWIYSNSNCFFYFSRASYNGIHLFSMIFELHMN